MLRISQSRIAGDGFGDVQDFDLNSFLLQYSAFGCREIESFGMSVKILQAAVIGIIGNARLVGYFLDQRLGIFTDT